MIAPLRWVARAWGWVGRPRVLGHEWEGGRVGQFVLCKHCRAYATATNMGQECPVRVLRARGF